MSDGERAPGGPAQVSDRRSRAEIDAALAGLRDATAELGEGLAALRAARYGLGEISGRDASPHSGATAPAADPGSGGPAAEPGTPHFRREAERYVEDAKRRADGLLAAMIAAAEQEAAAIRSAASSEVDRRRRATEEESARCLAEARAAAGRMVASEQRRIAALSGKISERASALSEGLAGAERIRQRFDGLVRSLAATADAIAHNSLEQPEVNPAVLDRASAADHRVVPFSRPIRPRRGAA